MSAAAPFLMAKDQFGNTFHDIGPHPSKALLEKLGRTKAQPMYQDKTDGRTVQTGYVIGEHWLTIYTVTPWERAA